MHIAQFKGHQNGISHGIKVGEDAPVKVYITNLNAMFEAVKLPTGISHLDSCLANVDR
jgi:hypothetical protein